MLTQLLEELQALLAAAEDEGRDLTDEEAERASELNDQIEAGRRRAEVQARSREFLAVSPPVSFAAPRPPVDTYERAFDHYLRTGQANNDLIMFRDQNVGTPGDGGYLVPDGWRDKIVEVRKAFGGLAAHADTFSTSTGNPLEYPTLDDTANVGSITAEATAFADGADLVFGSVTLGAYKFTSSGAGTTTPLRVSAELLQDSAFDVQGMVSRRMGERIARKEAAMWCVGSGSGEPQGIAGSSITENMDTDVHDVVDYEDLIDMEAALDAEYEANARWLMAKSTWIVIRKIVDGDNRPLIQANAQAGIGAGVEKMLLGYPVVIDQEMPDFPGAGDEHFIILGDLREAYAIRRVADLVVVVNPWTRANEGQVEFTAYSRADGVVQNRAAYILMANTAS
jgi:HK97 family phage major capsid protein